MVFLDHTHLLFLEFRYQIIELSMKFRKGFAKFMIQKALFKKFLSKQCIASVGTCLVLRVKLYVPATACNNESTDLSSAKIIC